jgi:Ca-activated chloride channel family protein
MLALICLLLEYLMPRLKIKYAKHIMAMALIMVISHPVNASHPGVSAYQDQNFQKAESEFKLTLNKRPDNGKVIYNLGNTYYKLGDHDKSIKAYQEAIDHLSEKEKIEAYYNLGTAQLKKNDMKKALESYKQVLQRDPNHIKTKQNIEIALRKQQQKQQQKDTQQQNSSEKNNDNSQEEMAQNNEGNSNEDSDEKSTASSPADETQDEQDQKETPNNKSNKELSEQQIQYLVDNAEKEAREKRQKKQEKLFEESEW